MTLAAKSAKTQTATTIIVANVIWNTSSCNKTKVPKVHVQLTVWQISPSVVNRQYLHPTPNFWHVYLKVSSNKISENILWLQIKQLWALTWLPEMLTLCLYPEDAKVFEV